MISGSRSAWIAAGILVAVFGAGALAGAAVIELQHPDRSVERDADALDGREDRGRRDARDGENRRRERPTRSGQSDRFVRFLKGRLDLTEDQERHIREVLVRNEQTAHELYESIRPSLEAGVEQAREEIRSILDEGQLERFNKFMSDERRRRRRGSGDRDGARPDEGPRQDAWVRPGPGPKLGPPPALLGPPGPEVGQKGHLSEPDQNSPSSPRPRPNAANGAGSNAGADAPP